MKLTRNWAWVPCLALLCLSYSASNNAQNATGNLVYTTVNPAPAGAQYNWSGFVVNNINGGGTSGGNTPVYNTQTGTFIFGYTQGTVAYSMAVNSALSGSGIRVAGYNYSWEYFNQDYSRGTLTGTIGITNNTGQVLQSNNFVMPKTFNGWTNMSGTQTFPTEYAATGLGNLTVSFTGKDDRYWAGYYGPQIRNIDVRLQYIADPCSTNPAYSPNCAGFNQVVTSSNLVPNAGAVATGGGGINNSFAINTAFRQAGTGLQIHGFEYGFYARANDYCAFELIVCWDSRKPSAQVNVSITNNNGTGIYSQQYNISNQSGNFNYRYLFPSSKQLGSLGNFNITAGTSDNAIVRDTYARAVYTPDLCLRNPTSSPACPGYFSAGSGSNNATSFAADTMPVTSTGSIASTGLITVTDSVSSTNTTPNSQNIITGSSTTSVTEVSSPQSGQLPLSVTTVSSTPITTTSVIAGAANTQTRIGEVSTSTGNTQSSSSSGQSSLSTGQLLNIVRAEQNRVARLESATVTAAVEQAARETEKSIVEAQTLVTTQQTAANASGESAMAAVNNAAANTQPLGTGLQVSTSAFSSLINPMSSGPSTISTVSIIPSTFGTVAPTVVQGLSEIQIQNFSRRQDIEEAVNQQSIETSASNLAFSATNPLNNYLNPPNAPAEAAPTSTGPSVNRNVQSNSAAGDRDIAVIATTPPGFDAYTAGTVPDSAFYAPKEIYRNQRTVDNARAQRALSGGSDRLHQQMIDQQYRIGQ